MARFTLIFYAILIPNSRYYTPLTTLVANTAVDIHLSNLTALRDWKGQMQWHLCHADGTVVERVGSKDVANE